MKRTISVLLILVLILAYFSVDVFGAGTDSDAGDPPVSEEPVRSGEEWENDPEPAGGGTEEGEEPSDDPAEDGPGEDGDAPKGRDDGEPSGEDEDTPEEDTSSLTWEEYAGKLYAETGIPEEHYIQNSDEKTVQIFTPDGLAWWAYQINNGVSFTEYTVSIENNLDMQGHTWWSIDARGDRLNGFCLDGKGHTISNITITGAVDGGRYGAGFFGVLNGSQRTEIKNLLFNNASCISSINQAGILIGRGNVYGSDGLILSNVIVSDSYVSGYGKVGGLIGHFNNDNSVMYLTLNSCSVSNTKVYAAYNAAGLVGLINVKEGLTLNDSSASVTWEKYPDESYACYSGTASFDGDGNQLAQAVTIENVYNTYLYQGVMYYYAAFGNLYNDYDEYLNKNEDGSTSLYFVGLSHAFAPHTGLTDWAVASEPADGEPGVMERHCNINVCDEREEQYFWYVTLHKNNGEEDEVLTHMFADKDVPTAFAKPETDPEWTDYLFKGWYSDEALTTEYEFTGVVTSNLDLYAKWERKQGTLTITKTGTAQETQSFLYRIEGQGYDLVVTVQGNGTVKIVGLPVGTYTIKEISSWSWRYTPSEAKTITLVEGTNTVTFDNELSINYWLSGENFHK